MENFLILAFLLVLLSAIGVYLTARVLDGRGVFTVPPGPKKFSSARLSFLISGQMPPKYAFNAGAVLGAVCAFGSANAGTTTTVTATVTSFPIPAAGLRFAPTLQIDGQPSNVRPLAEV